MNPFKAAYRVWKLRSEWLGEGGEPVSPDLAQERAAVCVSCPKNHERFYEDLAEDLVAKALKIDRYRKQLQCATMHDVALHVCDGCGCVLRLKVHVPLEHVVATTDLDSLQTTEPRCWILTESDPK